MTEALALSVVLPVHDEGEILARSVEALDAGCASLVDGHEILLMENGSRDDTLAVARRLAERPRVRVFTNARASYGQAMRAGLFLSRAARCAVLNVDLWDLGFLREALARLDHVDVVVGSKRHSDARDERPASRRLVTELFNRWLEAAFAHPGTDTHGMKAFRRAALVPLAARCETRDLLFDTELLLRAVRAGCTFEELPVHVREVRPPRSSPFARVGPALREMAVLRRAMHRLDSPADDVGARVEAAVGAWSTVTAS
ncbi:MAG: glycosyltransferase family 2 protein [Myxococcales bacterium]|nr:glycosyltransferase family 2 protein [Myxococcales bacterium]